MQDLKPDYKRIFNDIIRKKCPDRLEDFSFYFNQENLSVLDIISINNKIFGSENRETKIFNQKHKSYNKETILQILSYQKKEKLNNIQLAQHFSISRNTVTKWKKLYLKSF